MINIIDSLAIDDILLIPRYSEVKSRIDVDLSVEYGKGFSFSLPFVPANMRDIMSLQMARVFYEKKALSIFHRFAPLEEQFKWVDEVASWDNGFQYVGFSVGAKEVDFAKVDELVKRGVKILNIDLAHGHSKACISMTEYISKNYPDVFLISGNVATGVGADALWKAGADIVRSGIGQGSICTTRIATGNGVPTITSLDLCRVAKLKLEDELGRKLYLMQDGGCASAGAVAKCLCFADIVMCGNLFSATDESPGELVVSGGIEYKRFSGSSTHSGKNKEGVESLQKRKGPVSKIIDELSDGIRSACSYQGVFNTIDLKHNPNFIKNTAAGIKESNYHDLNIILK